MTFWWKLGIFIVYTVFLAYGGWQVRVWYDGSKQEKIEAKAVVQTQQGEQNIIKFNTDLGKNAKDPCFNTAIPADTNSLLK